MNFDLSEEQQVIKDLALQIFSGQATVERVKAVEKGDGFDRDLWDQLASSGIQALCVPEEFGGSGFGAVELSLALMGQGRHVAPVPLWTSGVAALALADFGSSSQQSALLPGIATGSTVVAIALAEQGANDVMRPTVVGTTSGGQVRINGFKPAVPFAQHASLALVPILLDGSVQVALIDLTATPGITWSQVSTTNREPQAHLEFDITIPVESILGHGAGIDGREALRSLYEHSLAALAAIQVGVAEGSLALTATHLSGRTQFGKPLSAFQATTQRAADGYITTEAMRVTALNAAWRLSEGFDARRDVAVAAYWASEGAQQVVTAAQHLHGGIGADIDYPVHRYFLWGIQLASVLGSASSHLSRLGNLIART
ncbi:MAG: acyl-CoA dehydrogenase family protein [Ilumatobacteraceae bacterium]